MIVLDASALIGHLSAADPHHHSATALLRHSEPGELGIHRMNLVEVLVGAARAGRAAELLGDIRALGVELLDADEVEPLRLAELRANSLLRLPDCCALDAAVVRGGKLATFDDRLRRAAANQGVTVRPEQV